MAQAMAETIFDALYLSFAIVVGIFLVKKGEKGSIIRNFGLMAIVLGAGDAFHLIPRVYALWTTGLEANAALLGAGKLTTSITMTVFYLILYYIWRDRYQIQGRRGLSALIWGLAIARAVLCALPQNEWFSANPPLLWGVVRNIPFAVMGVILIVLFAVEAAKANDRVFRCMWLAIALSFGFYLPVVLFADRMPMLGMLMIPKTLAYVWVVAMGLRLYTRSSKEKTAQ